MANCTWSESGAELTLHLDAPCTASEEALREAFTDTEFRRVERPDPETIVLELAFDPSRVVEEPYPGVTDDNKNLYSRFSLEYGALHWLQHTGHQCVSALPERQE